MTITITNDKGEKLDIIASKRTMDKIIDILYPTPGIRDASKGYISLVNHIHPNH